MDFLRIKEKMLRELDGTKECTSRGVHSFYLGISHEDGFMRKWQIGGEG